MTTARRLLEAVAEGSPHVARLAVELAGAVLREHAEGEAEQPGAKRGAS